MSPYRLDAMTPADIVELIMTQHWDLDPCACWVCQAGRQTGCRAQPEYLDRPHSYRGRVWVDPALHEPKHWAGPGWGTDGWP